MRKNEKEWRKLNGGELVHLSSEHCLELQDRALVRTGTNHSESLSLIFLSLSERIVIM